MPGECLTIKRGEVMKTIGLIGGMSWESSLEYYRIINHNVKNILGGLHSAKSIMYSVDFAEIEKFQHKGEWNKLAVILTDAALSLERAGADFVLICTNTMHKVYEKVKAKIDIPLVHIADPTARAVQDAAITKIGLLGTRFTMEDNFYKGRLEKEHKLDVMVPNKDQREVVHRVIYEELCHGLINPDSKSRFIDIINFLTDKGAGGIILGCTEIGLLIKQSDCDAPIFDTTQIHAQAAVEYALAKY